MMIFHIAIGYVQVLNDATLAPLGVHQGYRGVWVDHGSPVSAEEGHTDRHADVCRRGRHSPATGQWSPIKSRQSEITT